MSILEGLWPHEITITPKGTQDGYGRASFDGTATTLNCTMQGKVGLMIDANGNQIGYDHVAYVPQDTTAEPGDRLVWGSKTHQIIGVRDGFDEMGSEHFKHLLLRRNP